jgi:hypothetical protein
VLKKSLTEPTLLEMSGNPTRDLRLLALLTVPGKAPMWKYPGRGGYSAAIAAICGSQCPIDATNRALGAKQT